jgi:P pilus assembly chaperone PapD
VGRDEFHDGYSKGEGGVSMLRLTKSVFLIILLLVPLGSAWAGISLSKTRVIFTQGERAEEITLHNTGQVRYLVQAGVTALTGKEPVSDFYVTPPLFLLEPGSNAVLRIIARENSLPTDRETAYWLRMNLIPAAQKPSADGLNTQQVAARLSFSLGMSVKLLYRPRGLPLTIGEAFSKVKIATVPGGVSVDNPTPYNMTFSELMMDGAAFHFPDNDSMIKPFSRVFYSSVKPVHHLKWSFINDYGGVDKLFQSSVQQ